MQYDLVMVQNSIIYIILYMYMSRSKYGGISFQAILSVFFFKLRCGFLLFFSKHIYYLCKYLKGRQRTSGEAFPNVVIHYWHQDVSVWQPDDMQVLPPSKDLGKSFLWLLQTQQTQDKCPGLTQETYFWMLIEGQRKQLCKIEQRYAIGNLPKYTKFSG